MIWIQIWRCFGAVTIGLIGLALTPVVAAAQFFVIPIRTARMIDKFLDNTKNIPFFVDENEPPASPGSE